MGPAHAQSPPGPPSASRRTKRREAPTSSKPPVQTLPHERVVREMRIRGQHAIDFLHLARTEIFVRMEAPTAGEQSLPSQDLVDSGDAARELVRRIEERGVRVGQLGAEREQTQRVTVPITRPGARDGKPPLQQLDRLRRPPRPLAEKAARKANRISPARRSLGEGGKPRQ